MQFTTTNSTLRTPFKQHPLLWVISGAFLLLWTVSLLGTSDIYNWLLENLLVFALIGTLTLTHKKFRLSDLSYVLIFFYLCLHIHGSMYTYAEAPIGYWLSDLLGWSRNNYDRIVHFSFGLLLAYPMREFFLKKLQLKPWLSWSLPVEVTLSISALYELLEWAVAAWFFPEQGPAYLGSQGDVWDAQKDIALAFTGAMLIITIVAFAKRIAKNKIKKKQVLPSLKKSIPLKDMAPIRIELC